MTVPGAFVVSPATVRKYPRNGQTVPTDAHQAHRRQYSIPAPLAIVRDLAAKPSNDEPSWIRYSGYILGSRNPAYWKNQFHFYQRNLGCIQAKFSRLGCKPVSAETLIHAVLETFFDYWTLTLSGLT
jgi:hypothetical protein